MTLTEAREVVEKLKHPGSVIFLDDPHHADEYIGRCKSFIAGYKAALESEAVKGLAKMVSAAADGSSHCCEDCPCGHWQVDAEQSLLSFNQFKEAQK